DRRIERLLLLEERRNRPPDRRYEPASKAPRTRCVDLPERVERRDLVLVGNRRRVREVGRELLNDPIEPRQRVVVFAVRRLAFRLERREIVGTRHLRNQRPTRPSTGLLALAYIRR